MNLRAMNMLYESIVKRGSLMVVPSGLADSLNLGSVMGMFGGSGLMPKDGEGGEGGRGPDPGPRVKAAKTTSDAF
jgi:hypothetical protein